MSIAKAHFFIIRTWGLHTDNPLHVHSYDAESWKRCSSQNRQKETISMTQPALSGVSTELRAHLLPAGHRQKEKRGRERESGRQREREKKKAKQKKKKKKKRFKSRSSDALVYAGKTLQRPKINKAYLSKMIGRRPSLQRLCAGGKKNAVSIRRAKAVHSEIVTCRREQRATYKGCWQGSVLSWASRTRSDPVHMQMRSAPSGEKVRSSKASSSQHRLHN